MKHKKRFWALVVTAVVVVLVGGGLFGASQYLYTFAFTQSKKTLSKKNNRQVNQLNKDEAWLARQKHSTWHIQATNAKLRLAGFYYPAAKHTQKTIVIAHGYMGTHKTMATYIKMFHKLGYNVLSPDDRGAGASQGSYIGFGWPDRLDYVKWIKYLLAKEGQKQEIGLFGVSMGAATVMMVSGQKLPSQVKAIVADCGYSTIKGELTYQLKRQFNLPSFPLITTAAWVTKWHTGFDFRAGSSIKELHKNKLPVFFIHGDSDTFVPTKMVYQNYAATRGAKQLWIAKKTGHAMAIYNYPAEYSAKVSAWYAKYLR